MPVKDHVDGWSLDRPVVIHAATPPEQMDLAHELVVKHTDPTVQDQLGASSPATAAVIPGNRAAWSTPERLISLTRGPSL
jgi:hypothetical protein